MVSRRIIHSALFLLGFGLFMFTRRSEIVPTIHAAIIIAPILVLRFTRSLPARRGILLNLVGFVLSMNIALWGLFEGGDPAIMLAYNLVRSSLLGILYFLPYMFDRLLYPKFKDRGFISCFIFPIAVTAVFFLSSIEGLFDGTTAKTVYSFGPLVIQQFNSLFGLWGFIFLYSWLAAVINYAWEKNFDFKVIKSQTIALISVFLAIVLFGAVRLSGNQPGGMETVKIAAVVLLPEDDHAALMDKVLSEKSVSPIAETVSRIERLAAQAAGNGAKIVTFQEFAIIVDEKDVPFLIDEYRRIACDNDIYLNSTYAYFSVEGKGENNNVLIDNTGEVKIDYTKRYLLGIGDYGETGVFRKGAEIIQIADTPYGRIGIATCRDMNFQSYIRQAGKLNVDIMFGPSYDWPKSVEPSYYHRAIENGFSFVRASYNGITYAEDSYGRILNLMDSDETVDGIMYADVPVRGTVTLYTYIGDVLGWLCLAGLLLFAIFGIKARKKA